MTQLYSSKLTSNPLSDPHSELVSMRCQPSRMSPAGQGFLPLSRAFLRRPAQRVAAAITGTDFGTPNSLFISIPSYRGLFKPYHKKLTELIHRKSNWKTFTHTCGAVHNVQGNSPIKNVLAMFKAIRESALP